MFDALSDNLRRLPANMFEVDAEAFEVAIWFLFLARAESARRFSLSEIELAGDGGVEDSSRSR